MKSDVEEVGRMLTMDGKLRQRAIALADQGGSNLQALSELWRRRRGWLRRRCTDYGFERRRALHWPRQHRTSTHRGRRRDGTGGSIHNGVGLGEVGKQGGR